MAIFTKVNLMGGVTVWQLSTDVYHMLDVLMLGFLVPAFILLSGVALRFAAITVLVHHISHLTTDFESSVALLNKISTKSFSLHFHCFVDVLFSLQIFALGFFMDEDMGVPPTAASFYRGLGYLLLAGYPLTVVRLLENTPTNPFVALFQPAVRKAAQ
eukprot:TRINITY_DN2610_c0_g1_i1.p1 TRINITY_DN2610_c0_g1~~TRINITY_DN2610_c0_g1_i1.p1  ORF type:complete len:158 (+),score=28.60 TRINITY_DN2610_c0_g1_i1:79-552(+)